MAEEAQEPGFGTQLTRTPGQVRAWQLQRPTLQSHPLEEGSGPLPRPLRPPEGGIARGAEQARQAANGVPLAGSSQVGGARGVKKARDGVHSQGDGNRSMPSQLFCCVVGCSSMR
jgi:hypothetical protein